VDLPVFAFELKDLPDMIRHAGNRMKRAVELTQGRGKKYSGKLASEDWLQLQFGWAPLISDLSKMVDFVGSVDKRLGEMDRLYSGSGLKRNYTVYNDVRPGDLSPREVYCSTLTYSVAKVRVFFQARTHRWVTVRWKPTSPPPWKSDEEKLAYTRKLVYGLNDISASTIWNAMPWSWLADWFGNVGDYLDAHRNTIPAEPTQVNLMHQQSVEASSFEWISNPYGATFSLLKEPMVSQKVRKPQNAWVPPSASLPFLNGKQLSILSAIATTRVR
jgi:hypothetical protein